MHFHFNFPSKHVIVTNYSCICDFIQLCQHCKSRIYDYTHLQLKWHAGLTQLYIVVKIVDLDFSCIYSHNHMVGMDKISSSVQGVVLHVAQNW